MPIILQPANPQSIGTIIIQAKRNSTCRKNQQSVMQSKAAIKIRHKTFRINLIIFNRIEYSSKTAKLTLKENKMKQRYSK